MGPDLPLRIALISYYLPSGSKIGVGYQVHELATELARRGHHVDVISECPPVPGAIYGHRHFPMTGSLRTFRFALAMRRLDFNGYDVLHAVGEDYWLWRRRVPAHIRTLHGSCFDEALHIRGAKGRLRMVLLGCTEVLASVVADQTTAVSPVSRRWTPWVRCVIPNGVSDRFAPNSGIRAAAPVVLFVGTWQGRKRGEMLAAAFIQDVLSRHPQAQLWMVCRDVPAGGHPSVIALGEVSDERLSELFQQAWVFCLPSSYEGFGLPYAEALTSGLPVIATSNPGARYVLGDGRAGVLTTDAQLGADIAGLLSDSDRRDRLIAAGLDQAQNFSLAKSAQSYEDLYRAVMQRNAARSIP